jgi:enoyl-[acyl-carrier-protein] reductase (NADH)
VRQLTAAPLATAFHLRGRAALVAGAGAEVERAIAGALTSAGATVVVGQIPTTGPDAVAALVDTCRERLGSVDIVVHVAHAPGAAAFAPLSTALWLVESVMPLLSSGASIVHVDTTGEPCDGAQAAVAAGLAGATRSQARQLGPRGVRTNLVVAGPAVAGSAGHVAAVVLFLASDEAAGITGETVVLSGSG